MKGSVMKYKYHIKADYIIHGIKRTYHGTYKTEKSAQKRLKDLHKWFPIVLNERIERIGEA